MDKAAIGNRAGVESYWLWAGFKAGADRCGNWPRLGLRSDSRDGEPALWCQRHGSHYLHHESGIAFTVALLARCVRFVLLAVKLDRMVAGYARRRATALPLLVIFDEDPTDLDQV
jgi:hypothetical protein